jgi:hypothetical protein
VGQIGHRRSERMLLDVPLVIRGESVDHKLFQEETFTVTVSAHGALLMLAAKVALGQKLTLLNPQNWDERESRVAYIGPAHAGLAQVAVEFRKPSPEFWPVDPVPSGWRAS